MFAERDPSAPSDPNLEISSQKCMRRQIRTNPVSTLDFLVILAFKPKYVRSRRSLRKANSYLFTLKVGHKLAHEESVEPNNRDILRHGHWHANHRHQKICHRQVDQKIVGDTITHKKKKHKNQIKNSFFFKFHHVYFGYRSID